MAQNATASSVNYGNLASTEGMVNISIKLYRVAEVAKIIRVKKSYVYELIYTGRLGAIRLSERRIMIPESSLQSFICKELGKVKKK